jgi:WD40 repeat protein
MLASAGVEGAVRLRELESGKVVRTLVGHEDMILDAIFAPDDRHVLSTGFDSTLRLWDLGTGEQLQSFDCTMPVHKLCLMPGRRNLLLAMHDGGIRLIDILNEHDLRLLPTSTVGRAHRATAFTIALLSPSYVPQATPGPKPIYAASGSLDGLLEVFDFENQEGGPIPAASTLDTADDGKVQEIAATANGHWLVSAQGTKAKLYDLSSAGKPSLLEDAGKEERCVAVSPGGSYALTGSANGKIALWDLGWQQKVDEIDLSSSSDEATEITVLPDGKSFVVGTLRGMVLRFSCDLTP